MRFFCADCGALFDDPESRGLQDLDERYAGVDADLADEDGAVEVCPECGATAVFETEF